MFGNKMNGIITSPDYKACCETTVTDPVFLPVGLELMDVPEYFRLQEMGRYLQGNTSLGSRTETYLLSHRGSHTPVVRATYRPFTARQEVPDELLDSGNTAAWSVRAVLIEGSVSPSDPYARVLFHLTGRDWMSEKPHLPCVILQAFYQTWSVHRACRLQAPLGVCVVELEFPQHWFSASSAAASHGLSDSPSGTSQHAELYFLLSAAAGKKDECSHEKRPGRHRRQGVEAEKDRLTHIANVEIKMAAMPRYEELQLDKDMTVRLPNRTLLPGEVFTATISVGRNFSVDLVNIRVKFKKGLYVIFARSAAPETWAMKLEKQRGAKPHMALVTCRRVDGGASDWSAADFPEFLYLDFGVENGTGSVSTRRVSWQVEYPGLSTSEEGEKVFWEVLVSDRDLRAIVPLVKEEEILNTAVLTGIPRKVPVKLVAVETGGFALDISNRVHCASSSVQVIQVTDTCDFVYVGGKESRGALKVRVDFWYERLWTSLHLRVWVPLLPLRVEVSDIHLEQIRGWRAAPRDRLSDLDQADEDGTLERKARECRPQYQCASVRFLAHFVAHPLDGGRHVTYLLGSDWLLDVSHLLREHARAKDPQVAVLEEGSILIGREPGVTSVEVRSPVSHSVLGEQTVVVSEEKVAISELRTQLVSGISLSLSSMAGHSGVFIATCQAQQELQNYKQESILSIWLQFSDHTMAPIELYSWQNLKLSITSADHRLVSTNPNVDFTHPVILVSEEDGEGFLLQVSIQAPEHCPKGKHRGTLASGTTWVRVNYDASEGRKKNRKIGVMFPTMSTLSDLNLKSESPFQRIEGSMLNEAPTHAAQSKVEVKKGRGIIQDSENAPQSPVWKFDLGRSKDQFSSSESSHFDSMDNYDDEEDDYDDAIVKAPQSVTDLEIGMYVLLGVFSLAILIFLINCITFILRYQHKKAPEADEASVAQPHNWLWLGTDQQELSQQQDQQNQSQVRCSSGDIKQGGAEGGNCADSVPKSRGQEEALEPVDEDQKDFHRMPEADCGVGVVGNSIGEIQMGLQDTQLENPKYITNTFHPFQSNMDMGLVSLSQGDLSSRFYSSLLCKELNMPASGILSQKESSCPGSNTLSRKELNTLLSGTLSRKELNTPLSGILSRKELNVPLSGSLSRKELSLKSTNTLARKEINVPIAGTLFQKQPTSQSSSTLSCKELNVPVSSPLFKKELSSQGSNTPCRKELNAPLSATLSQIELNFQGSNSVSCKERNLPISGILSQKETPPLGSSILLHKKMGSQGSSNLSQKEPDSQVSWRKRGEFVTFAPRISDGSLSAPVQSILVASEEDIRWVCEDMGLKDPEELQSYMERIRGSS
ncbi:transmembrane protein 132A isoform X2 [Microcaecilia unicolor]|uniref:Transmembrane protein 132A isoform X2 n=1 Tax=Microcaecilia unicolor TaxID=1415580 RepID=A0A6P7ZFF0_9AMPH|nr:transmembrane protein 132A isoform X2 [Microcaecilia unicolor]